MLRSQLDSAVQLIGELQIGNDVLCNARLAILILSAEVHQAIEHVNFGQRHSSEKVASTQLLMYSLDTDST